MFQQPAWQLGFVVGAGPAVVFQALVEPEPDVAPGSFESLVQQLALARRNYRVVGSVEEPHRRAAHRARAVSYRGFTVRGPCCHRETAVLLRCFHGEIDGGATVQRGNRVLQTLDYCRIRSLRIVSEWAGSVQSRSLGSALCTFTVA